MTDTRKSGDHAAAWLATWFVMCGGIGACLFIALSAGDGLLRPLLLLGGGGLALAAVLWLLREPRKKKGESKLRFLLARHRSESRRTAYRWSRRTSTRSEEQNRPPTLEEIRDLSSSTNTWVPSENRDRRTRTPRD